MTGIAITIGLVAAAAAALVHVAIFYLESIAWEGPQARATFGTSAEEARATKELAFNQGFYNLFLAVLVVIGIIVTAAASTVVGSTLVLSGTGVMLAAALVLLISSPQHRTAAIKQGAAPLVAIFCLVLGWVS